jgi:hypothetical protein
MRFVTALAVIGVCAAGPFKPVFAQTPDPPRTAPKPVAATPVAAKPGAAKAAAKPAKSEPSAHAAAPLAERIALQSDLVWTGDLNSIADGAWGDRSSAAVKSFQKRKGGKETGTLTDEERAALAADAKAKQAEVGWRMVADDNDVRLGIPAKLVPQRSKGKSGGHWQSAHGEISLDVFRQPAPATIPAVHLIEMKNPGRKVTYNVVKPDFFVISGTQGLKKFYMRAQAGNGEVRGFLLTYDQANAGMMEPLVVAISGAFAPFPQAAQTASAPGARRRVEYSTGVIVSAAGDILADRDSVDDCQVIVANGFGNAERVADDKASGLALIRVYGAHDVKAIALGDAAKGDVTLVGVPDPQAQGGKAAVTTAKAKVLTAGDGNTLDPAPAPGFSGAAALDADAGLVGIAVQKPVIVAGPAPSAASSSIASADAIRKFLAAHDVAAASGKTSADAAKQSVVRVICVRK